MSPTRGAAHDPVVRVTVLGRLAVTGNVGAHTFGAATNKGLVLSLLASRCNEVVSYDDLVDAMWPDGPPKSYRTALRVVVQALRDVVEPARVLGDVRGSPIVGHQDGYELRISATSIDSGQFELLVRDGQQSLSAGHAEAAALAFRNALALWGEPFAGADCPALRTSVERLRLAQRAASTGLLEADLQLGREDLGEIERAVQDDPLDERRWGHLMIALFRRDRQADALAAYQRARRTLIDEIGVEPGQYLRRVEEQILLQDGALLDTERNRPIRVEADRWPPAPRSMAPLLMRSDELRRLDAQLDRWRLITIVGPPGVGKTTLAAALARARPPTSVAWVSLGDVPVGPGAVIDMTTRLGVVSEIGADPSEYRRLLAARIGDQPLLLVLDNVEHLIESVAEVVTELARSCPNLMMLMTSRRPVGLLAEQVFRLTPFDHAVDRELTQDDTVNGSPSRAAEYLTERAGLDAVGRTQLSALERIGAHVGGLALGLEQAAACLQMMSPAELAERLELIDDKSGADGLTRAISWSLALLDPDATELLRCLAHFDAPWSMARAEAVGVRLGLEERHVPRIVASLFDHSLIIVAGNPESDRTTESMRRIVEPVRHHVRQLSLGATDPDRYPLACAQSILAEVIEAARFIEGVDQRVGLRRMRALMPDIRGTVIWAARADQPLILASVLAELRAWWWTSGLYADGQTLHSIADPLITRWTPTSTAHRTVRLRALSTEILTRPGFGGPAMRVGALDQWLDEAISIGAPLALQSWIAQLLSAGIAFGNREPGRAEKLAVKAIEDGQSAGEPWLVAWGRYALALARVRIEPVEGLALFEQAISAFSTTGDQLNAARITMYLGHGSRIFGDTRSSGELFSQAEQWCAQLGAAPVTQLDCELGRAQSADTAGRTQEAAVRYRALVPRLWELGDYRCAAVAQRGLAAIMAADGDLDGASALVSRAMETLRGLDHEEAELAATLLVRAEIAEARQQCELAARLLGRARSMAGGAGIPIELRDVERIDALATRLAGRLGAAELDQLQAAGREDRFL